MRDDTHGKHFDPRTVALKFQLTGANGVFLPLVVDLVDGKLHWLDIYSRGMLAFNNVATSDSSITSLCPRLIEDSLVYATILGTLAGSVSASDLC